MKLVEALLMRKEMEGRGRFFYRVMRGRRSPGVAPFYVRRGKPQDAGSLHKGEG